MADSRHKVVLVYPELGLAGTYHVAPPVGLLYVASRLPDGCEAVILDCRIEQQWRKRLREYAADPSVLLVGVSVMSGLPVFTGAEATAIVKEVGDVPVVWGGTHPTILPGQTLGIEGVDWCVRGFGSRPMAALVEHLLGRREDVEDVRGLCRGGGEPVISDIEDTFEDDRYESIPYHLLDPVVERYFQGQGERSFPLYTVWGCAYNCSFCISPLWYRGLKTKWRPFPAKDVVDHIDFLMRRYRVSMVYFIDDDSFVRFEHFAAIAAELKARDIKVRVGVRGLRVNEAQRMRPEDFALLQEIGVRFVHIGVESGSDAVLKIMNKGIKVRDSLEANKKLAGYPGIIPMYNILCGVPGETMDDLRATGEFMLRLAEDNPRCIIFDPGKFIPYPGTKLYDAAVEHGFTPPEDPGQWRSLDQESDVYQPWYTKEYNDYINMLQVASYALSNWEAYLEGRQLWLRVLFKAGKVLYRPVAKWRIRHGYAGLLVEVPVLRLMQGLLVRLSRLRDGD